MQKKEFIKQDLNEKVNIEIKDYRDLKGKYNSISINRDDRSCWSKIFGKLLQND